MTNPRLVVRSALAPLALAFLLSGCAGSGRVRPIIEPVPSGEKLPIHLALYFPADEYERVAPLEDAEGRTVAQVPVGRALADLSRAHLSQLCEVVKTANRPKPPLDADREALLLEMETLELTSAQPPGDLEWTVQARVSGALRLRYFREYKGRGPAPDFEAPPDPKGWTPVEKSLNAAMVDIAAQIWFDLDDELADAERF